MSETAYLDNNASTPLLPSVRQLMAEAMEVSFANPSSQHALGVECARRIEQAREEIALFFGCDRPSDLHFSWGATDAIGRCFDDAAPNVDKIVVTGAEHAAVQSAARRVAAWGVPTEFAPITLEGQLDLKALERLTKQAKSLVSVSLVNGETGAIADIAAVGDICKRNGALLHVDASQGVGRVEFDLRTSSIDYATMSPHKFHGPKGVGLLYAKAPRDMKRGGTANVVGAVGAAAAIGELSNWRSDIPRIAALRDRLESALIGQIQHAAINGDVQARVANTTNIYFPMRNAADLVAALSRRGVYVSAGAACTTGGEPSPVLRAMGLGDERANASLRFSLSKLTTEFEIVFAIEQTVGAFRSTLATRHH